MLLAGGRAPDQKRRLEVAALHLSRNVDHLVERGRDQAAQPDEIGLLIESGLQNLIAGDHDSEVRDLVVVTL